LANALTPTGCLKGSNTDGGVRNQATVSPEVLSSKITPDLQEIASGNGDGSALTDTSSRHIIHHPAILEKSTSLKLPKNILPVM
jgi:hypothetical protein